MIQNVLSDIGGIGIYGIISICLFFLVFSGVLVRVFLLKRADLESMRSLPLREDAPVDLTKGENCHERE